MGWTEAARREHDIRELRYTSDCTDPEWALIAPLLERTTKVGRPRRHRVWGLWNAIQYLATTGCQWAQLPKDFPPFQTVQYDFYRMRNSGLLDAINAVLVAETRVAEGRDVDPTAGIIDSQSIKTTEAGGPRGYDAGKKIKGRKRHIGTDTAGNLLDGLALPANIQDRDGAPDLIECCRDAYPSLVRFFADGGYAGQKLSAAIAHIDHLAIDVVRRSDATASSSCRDAGWSNEPLHGSTGAGVSLRTGKPPSPPQKHSSSSLPSGDQPAASQSSNYESGSNPE